MSAFDVLLVAWEAVRSNLLRSVLTALGVIIGIAAVIVMVSVGQGTQQRLDETISRMGSNRLEVGSGGGRGGGGARLAAGSVPTLTEHDAEAIRNEIPGVQYVAVTARGGAQVVHGAQNWATSLIGINPDYIEVNGLELSNGQWFAPRDYQSAAKVAVIGETVRAQLFGDADPVGSTIRVQRVPFRVVGVLVARGQANWGGDLDDVVVTPIATAKRRVLGQVGVVDATVHGITIAVARPEDLKFVEVETASLLRQRHRIQPGAQDDFSVRNMTEMVAARSETTRLMSLLLAAVASISLVVGGIGIMNIMLVSVTERIREIGLRAAVGATPGEIRAQFMAEAMCISLAGGLIGIVLGVIGTLVAARIGALPVALNPTVIGIATGFSVATGLFFGYYPAHKAAQLDPIEALRHD